jgi:hypothetical protein
MTGWSSSHWTPGPWGLPVGGRPSRRLAAATSPTIASQTIARIAAASPGTKSAGSAWPARHRPLARCRIVSRASDRIAPLIVCGVRRASRPVRSSSRKARSKSASSTGIPNGVRRLSSTMATSTGPDCPNRAALEMASTGGFQPAC